MFDGFTTDQLIAIAQVAVPTLITLVGAYFFVVRWLWNYGQKPEPTKTEITNIEELHSPAHSVGTMTLTRDDYDKLTIEVYEARQRELKAKAEDEQRTASGDRLAELATEIAELDRRLANPEEAFEQAKARIKELDELLRREGNLLGAERLERAENALAEGDFDEADKLLAEISAEEDLAVQRKARAEYGRGQIAEEQVRWHDAAVHYGDAARLNATYDHLYKARAFHWRAGDYVKAEAYGTDLLQVAREEFGKGSPEFAEAVNEHAITLQYMGRLTEAEPLFREALEVGKATIGEQHPDYATRLNNLANLLRVMGRYGEAERLFRDALEIDKMTIGEGHPDYAARLNNFATLLRDTGRYAEAEPLFREALETIKVTIGGGHPDHATLSNNLAKLLQDMGRQEEARPLFAEAVLVLRKALGDEHPHTKKGAGNYARLLRAHFPEDPALSELQVVFGGEIGT